MAKTPNTRPEQITDKNGKVTTVHKSSNTERSSKANKKIAALPAAPQQQSREDRVQALVESINNKAFQSENPTLFLRTAIAVVEGVGELDRRNNAVESIVKWNPDVAGIKTGVDVMGRPAYAGALDAKGNEIEFRVDPGLAWKLQKEVSFVARFGFKDGNPQPTAVYFSEGSEHSQAAKDMFAGEEDLMNEFTSRDIARGLYESLSRESQRELGERLRAIDPEITGVGYAVDDFFARERFFDSGHGELLTKDGTTTRPLGIRVSRLYFGNGEGGWPERHPDAERIAEVLSDTRQDDLVNPYLTDHYKKIEF